jgi:predicted nucleotidyltransferase
MNILQEITKIYNKYSEQYDVFGVFLYGSQNYELATEKSDLDLKVIIMPKLKDIVDGAKMISVNHEFEYGLVELKDIRAFSSTFLKANPSYIEPFATSYYYINPQYEQKYNIISFMLSGIISEMKPNLAKAIYGMMLEKQKALCHLYPSQKEIVEEIGYAPKQFHHIKRLETLLTNIFTNKMGYRSAMIYHDKELLLKYKLDIYPIEFVKQEVTNIIAKTKEQIDDIVKTTAVQETPNINRFKEIVSELIIESIKKQISHS